MTVMAVLMAAVSWSASGRRSSSWEKDADLRKADYAYMQALSAINIDSNDLAQRLVDYAAVLAPEDIGIKALQAMLTLNMNATDSAEVYRSYAVLWDEFRADPTQYYNGSAIASIAQYLHLYDDVIEVWRTLDSIYPERTETAANLANAYIVKYATGDTSAYAKAMAIFARLERGTGKDMGLSSQKIRAMALKKDTMAIVRELNELEDANPRDPDVFLYASEIYKTLNVDTARYASIRRACEIDSTYGAALIAMAQYYADKNDSAAYDRQVFRALVSPTLEYETKHELLRGYVGRMYSDTAQWPRIENVFARMQQINPGEPSLHSLYSAFEYTCGNITQATEQMEYALSLDPSNADVRSSLYSLQMHRGDTTAAIATAVDGITYSPDNLAFPILAASADIVNGRPLKALETLHKVKINEINNPEAVSNFMSTLGDAYQAADSLGKAIETYNKSIEIYPSNVLAYNNAAYAMAQNDTLLDQALSYARYAVLSDMENPTYLDTYAWVYFKKRDYPQAKKYIDLTLKYSSPDSIRTDDTIAVDTVMLPEGFASDSIVPDTAYIGTEAPETDVELETDEDMDENYDSNDMLSAEVLSHAGDIYFMSGLPEQALKFWEQAAKLAPEDEMLARKVKYKTYFYDDKKGKKITGRREKASESGGAKPGVSESKSSKTAPVKSQKSKSGAAKPKH